VQTFVEIGSAVRKIFPDKKNKQIESISRVAQLTLGARLIKLEILFRRKNTLKNIHFCKNVEKKMRSLSYYNQGEDTFSTASHAWIPSRGGCRGLVPDSGKLNPRENKSEELVTAL